jgi:hypothetical protein
MQFSSDAVDELLFGASAVIQSAVIAAVLDHYEDMEEMDHPRRSRISAQPRSRTMKSDDQQQTTTVPTDLLHSGEHFDDVPDSLLRLHRRRHARIELPRPLFFR